MVKAQRIFSGVGLPALSAASEKEAVLWGISSGYGFACIRHSLNPSTRTSVAARQCHSSVSTVAQGGSHGILTVSAIAIAVRLRLRTRLTPG